MGGIFDCLAEAQFSSASNSPFLFWRQKETEKDDLPVLAGLPGLNVALAEDLLSQMTLSELLQSGAIAMVDALGRSGRLQGHAIVAQEHWSEHYL